MCDREDINQRGRGRYILCVDVGARVPDRDRVGGGRSDANGPQPGKCAGVRASNTNIRVLNWILSLHISANEAVTETRFINHSRAYDVNILKGDQAVVLP